MKRAKQPLDELGQLADRLRHRDWTRFKADLTKRIEAGEPIRLIVSRLSIRAALDTPEISDEVLRYMAMARLSAEGRFGSPMECFGCAKPWTMGRAPAAIVVLDLLDQGKMLAALCRVCAPDDAALAAAARRDFGASDLRLVAASGTA